MGLIWRETGLASCHISGLSGDSRRKKGGEGFRPRSWLVGQLDDLDVELYPWGWREAHHGSKGIVSRNCGYVSVSAQAGHGEWDSHWHAFRVYS